MKSIWHKFCGECKIACPLCSNTSCATVVNAIDNLDAFNHISLLFHLPPQELDILTFAEQDGQINERNKRTIGMLRELFPTLSQVSWDVQKTRMREAGRCHWSMYLINSIFIQLKEFSDYYYCEMKENAFRLNRDLLAVLLRFHVGEWPPYGAASPCRNISKFLDFGTFAFEMDSNAFFGLRKSHNTRKAFIFIR